MNILGALLDAHQRARLEVPLIEHQHEHAVEVRIGLEQRARGGGHCPGTGRIRPDEIALLDDLQLAVLVDLQVLGREVADERAAIVADHDIHLDGVGRRAKHRRLRGRALCLAGVRDGWREEQRRHGAAQQGRRDSNTSLEYPAADCSRRRAPGCPS